MSDPSGVPNRLAASSSPYLLQHAHNPVDWHPWGDEAIEAARSSGRPIFLSVGYSTCHWCHVMERESFEDHDTAALMNERFVNIKVDREEHPDVDQIYMAVVQAMTGHGGWPMSVFLTPDLTPYFAGTYFPPEPRYGHPAFRQILERCAAAWETEPEKVAEHGRGVMKWFEEREAKAVPDGEKIVSRGAIERCVKELRHGFDAHYGGFGGAPKFPRSMTLMLLLRHRLAAEGEENDTLEMVEKTLEMMWRGGLWDHVGHGFARYSTDERWLVPHFEKMLYDNALLAMSYAEAWQVTGNDDWRTVGTQTLDWVLAEMTHADGGFFSAQDADSEGEEGKFYVWSPDELEAALGADDAEFVSRVWGVDPYGNFEGKSILYLPKTLDETAAVLETTREELVARLEPLREKLYAVRDARVHPGLDDKVLTSWNGLMIASMARCGATFGEPRFTDAARAAAVFARDNLVDDGGGLLRRWREGDAALTGTLEDFAFLAWGLLELFEATSEPEWLAWAERLVEEAIELFHDDEKGGFFFTREGEAHLVVRMKEPYDGATPSGNSVMALNLLRLADLRDIDRYRELADRTIAAFGDNLSRMPSAYPLMLCALERALTPPMQVVVAGEGGAAEALLRKVRTTFSPHAVVVHVRDDNREGLTASMPWLSGKEDVEGAAAAWVCRQFTCELPVTSPDALDL